MTNPPPPADSGPTGSQPSVPGPGGPVGVPGPSGGPAPSDGPAPAMPTPPTLSPSPAAAPVGGQRPMTQPVEPQINNSTMVDAIRHEVGKVVVGQQGCLLYTSDAADE